MQDPSAVGTDRARGPYSWLALLAVLGLCAALRLYNVHVPFVDTSDWRQTDTAAIAYFYYHQGIQLLHPQLWHDGPGPDYTQLELQISPAVAAALAHIFGYGHVLLRSVAIGFFTLSVVPLWALVRRRFGESAALWTALCYVLLPVGIFFGRVFQPEPAMCFFGTAALWAADRWGDRRTLGRYLLAIVLASVAVLAKLPNGMLLPVIVALAYGNDLWRWRAMFSGRRLVPAGLLVIVPSLAGAVYTIGQGRIASAAGGTKYVNFIVTSLGSSYIAGATSLVHYLTHNVLGMAITPGGGIAMLLGLAWLLRAGKQRSGWLWVWCGCVLVYGLVVLRAIRFQYYLMPILPFFAVLMGLGLDWLARALPHYLPRALRIAPAVLAAALTASILSGGLFEIRGYWPPYLLWYQAGRAMNRALPKDAVVILTGTFNPTLLYYARRHGYRVNPLTMGALEADVYGKARYLVDQGGISGCMSTYLQQNFPYQDIGGVTVFTLRLPLPPLPANAYGNCLT